MGIPQRKDCLPPSTLFRPKQVFEQHDASVENTAGELVGGCTRFGSLVALEPGARVHCSSPTVSFLPGEINYWSAASGR
jgi:hypothetical protein